MDVTFSVEHMPLLGGNFHKIFEFKNLNLCEITRSSNPIIKALVDFGNQTITNGAIKKNCPYYGPGLFNIVNATFSKGPGIQVDGIHQNFPNGIYRTNIKCSNKRDDNKISLSINVMHSFRENKLENDGDKF